jgi:hypothetical protein
MENDRNSDSHPFVFNPSFACVGMKIRPLDQPQQILCKYLYNLHPQANHGNTISVEIYSEDNSRHFLSNNNTIQLINIHHCTSVFIQRILSNIMILMFL